MNIRVAVLAILAAPVWAQVATPVSASIGPRITPQSFTELEQRFDSALAAINPMDPVDILGKTRIVYLPDYGLVITTEVSLVVTLGPSPFRKEITAAEKQGIHTRKVQRVPMVKKSMRELMGVAARTLMTATGFKPEASSSLNVVYVVRCLYLGYEDMSGLPAQIFMRASLKNALAGDIQEIEQ